MGVFTALFVFIGPDTGDDALARSVTPLQFKCHLSSGGQWQPVARHHQVVSIRFEAHVGPRGHIDFVYPFHVHHSIFEPRTMHLDLAKLRAGDADEGGKFRGRIMNVQITDTGGRLRRGGSYPRIVHVQLNRVPRADKDEGPEQPR